MAISVRVWWLDLDLVLDFPVVERDTAGVLLEKGDVGVLTSFIVLECSRCLSEGARSAIWLTGCTRRFCRAGIAAP